MAVDMSGVLRPVKCEVQAGRISLGNSVWLYVIPHGHQVDVSFTDQRLDGWFMDRKTLMNLSEAARLLAEALP